MGVVSYLLTKGAGIGSVAYALRDANYVGKMTSDYYATEEDAKDMAKYLENDMYLNSLSYTQNQIKEKSFEHEMDSKYKRIINEPIGYIKGFTESLMKNIIPFALGSAAILLRTPMFSKTKHQVSGVLSNICALIAGGSIAKESIESYFALGQPNMINREVR